MHAFYVQNVFWNKIYLLQECHKPIKQQMTISCCNLRAMAEATQPVQVPKEMVECGTEMPRISENRWSWGWDQQRCRVAAAKVAYVGDQEVWQGGVAILMSATAKRVLMEWTPMSKRIIKAWFYLECKASSVIHMLAPTNAASMDEEKDEFYSQLQGTI